MIPLLELVYFIIASQMRGRNGSVSLPTFEIEIAVRRLMALEIAMEQGTWELTRHVQYFSGGNYSAVH